MAVLSAGLECDFLNVSVYLKHECVVVELISHGRIERGELMHNGGKSLCNHNPVGSENECFKHFCVNSKPIMR